MATFPVQAGPVQGTAYDRSITAVANPFTGADQALLAANSARNYLFMQNTGNANVIVNPTGGVASAGGSGCVVLLAYGTLEFKNWIPTNAIRVNGVVGQTLTVIEG